MAIDWKRIEDFIGFGRPDAPIVFLGMEEGLQRDADLRADLELRSTYEPYMDLAEAQGGLEGPLKFFGASPITQRTWRPMCHVMLRWEGVPHPTRDQRVRYQADRLGRRDGDSLLVELLPYPHPDTSQWLDAYAGRYSSRDDYTAEIVPKRIELLRRTFSEHPRALIIAYGKRHWQSFKLILGDVNWSSLGGFEFAQIGSARVVLSTHFSSRAFNTEEQLDNFADVALGDQAGTILPPTGRSSG